MIKKCLPTFLIIFLSCCGTHHGNYAVISSSPMSLYNLASNNEIVAEQVSNSVSQNKILFIPLNKKPKIDNAIAKIVKKYQGDYMTNISIEEKSVSFLPLYQKTTWTITGDIIRVHK